MATLSTATSNFSSLVHALVQKRIEDILRARMVYTTPGSFETAEYEKGGNGQFRFVAYAALAANTTALTEGSPPTAQSLVIDSDLFSATQMGWTVEITDLALLQDPHNLIAVSADRIAYQAAASQNEVVRQAYRRRDGRQVQ